MKVYNYRLRFSTRHMHFLTVPLCSTFLLECDCTLFGPINQSRRYGKKKISLAYTFLMLRQLWSHTVQRLYIHTYDIYIYI